MIDLKQYNQEQILKYYDELNDNEKNNLLNQINTIDYSLVNEIYKNSYNDDVIDMNQVTNLNIIKKEDISDDNNYLGENLIRNNGYAVVLMAGGFGSRLGLDIPKGCLELKLKDKTISLFELYINQIKEANKKYNSNINLYIMTGNTNTNKTIEYFENNNYFDYKDNIKIFTQSNFPILNTNGKILLKNKGEILMGPNGNGAVFSELKRYGLLDDIKNKNIKYVLFSTIDNVLSNIVDVKFISTVLKNNYKLATKTIMKEDENNKGWVFCKYNNKPFMLPSAYITPELTNTKDKNNEYIYRETNITYHLISIDYIEEFSNIDLRYHRAYKNNRFLDENGNYTTTEDKNSFKFEKFIFDAFYYADDMLLYRVNKDDFCPIKEKDDINKAIDALKNKMS